VSKTAKPLAHEQFHYDVSVVLARAAAKHFNRLRASTKAKLLKLLTQASSLHLVTRNQLVQQRYDIDTHHGTNAHYQKVWKDRMKQCPASSAKTVRRMPADL
jgi:predicted secreted Zn-dependent protease